jgi:hypothetical protein
MAYVSETEALLLLALHQEPTVKASLKEIISNRLPAKITKYPRLEDATPAKSALMEPVIPPLPFAKAIARPMEAALAARLSLPSAMATAFPPHSSREAAPSNPKLQAALNRHPPNPQIPP